MPPQEVNIHVVGNILAGPQAGVNIILISIPFGIDKFERNWGHFFQIGGNVLVEYEKKILIGGIFLKIGGIFLKNCEQWGKCVSGI